MRWRRIFSYSCSWVRCFPIFLELSQRAIQSRSSGICVNGSTWCLAIFYCSLSICTSSKLRPMYFYLSFLMSNRTMKWNSTKWTRWLPRRSSMHWTWFIAETSLSPRQFRFVSEASTCISPLPSTMLLFVRSLTPSDACEFRGGYRSSVNRYHQQGRRGRVTASCDQRGHSANAAGSGSVDYGRRIERVWCVYWGRVLRHQCDG